MAFTDMRIPLLPVKAKALKADWFRAVPAAVQFCHMMKVVGTVQSAGAIWVLGYKHAMRPGGEPSCSAFMTVAASLLSDFLADWTAPHPATRLLAQRLRKLLNVKSPSCYQNREEARRGRLILC